MATQLHVYLTCLGVSVIAEGSLAALLKTLAYSFTIFKVFSSSRLESVPLVFNIGDSQQSSFKVG